MLEEGNLVMQGLYLITHVALLDPESVNLLLEHSIVPDGFATLAKARVHALTVLVDVIAQVTQHISVLESKFQVGAAGLDKMLDECADAVTARFDQMDATMLYDSAAITSRLDKMAIECEKLKMAVLLMGGMLWFNLVTLVVIMSSYILWTAGLIKAGVPPAVEPDNRSNVEITLDGWFYVMRCVADHLVMDLLKE